MIEKQALDMRRGGGLFFGGQSSTSSNTVVYPMIGNNYSVFVNTTEATFDYPISFGFTLTRLKVVMVTNTKNGATVVGFRDDGVTVASLSIPAGSTTEVDGGALSVAVAAGSKINFIRDATGSSSGSIEYMIFAEYET